MVREERVRGGAATVMQGIVRVRRARMRVERAREANYGGGGSAIKMGVREAAVRVQSVVRMIKGLHKARERRDKISRVKEEKNEGRRKKSIYVNVDSMEKKSKTGHGHSHSQRKKSVIGVDGFEELIVANPAKKEVQIREHSRSAIAMAELASAIESDSDEEV